MRQVEEAAGPEADHAPGEGAAGGDRELSNGCAIGWAEVNIKYRNQKCKVEITFNSLKTRRIYRVLHLERLPGGRSRRSRRPATAVFSSRSGASTTIAGARVSLSIGVARPS